VKAADVRRGAPLVPGRAPLRLGPVSTVRRTRTAAVGALLAAACLLLICLGTARGEFPLPLTEVLRVLAGGGDEVDRVVVLELRLPRAAAGALVGFALGMAGAITQSVARNPLASPDLLGISAGAGAGAVTLIVLGGAAGPLAFLGVPAAALVGALGAAALVYVLAWREGIEGLRLALVGLAVAGAGTSLTTYLLLRANLTEATQATVWLTGSLNGRSWDQVVPLAVMVLFVLAVAAAFGPRLAALQLGPDSARSLGLRVQSSMAVLVLAAVVLAAGATAAAGPVGFVALVAPQIALRLIRSAGPPPLTSGLTGAALVLTADLLARTALPVELPVGIVTAVVGAPYLIYLLVTANRRSNA
jgi:iron complex transport system permease protein